MRMQAGHDFEEHTSEVRVRLSAPTLPSLFEEACRALADIMAESPLGVGSADERVSVKAPDRAALLAEWLNELIYRTESEGRIFTTSEIERLSDTELIGRIGGAAVGGLKTPVKAATFHDLSVEPLAEDGWTASVVLDV